MLFDHLHRVIENEYKLLHSLHFKDGNAPSMAISHDDMVDTLIESISPLQIREIKRAISDHLGKIRDLKQSPVQADKNTMKKAFEALKRIRDDPISKTLSDSNTVLVVGRIENNLKSMPVEEKKAILDKEEKTKAGLASALLKILIKVIRGIGIATVSITQIATVVVVVACLVQVFSVNPKEAFQQRMTSMVTTGDFISNLNNVSNTNILKRFTRSALFQGNELFWTTGMGKVNWINREAVINTTNAINKFIPVGELVKAEDVNILLSIPLDSREVLDKLNTMTKIQLNYYAELEKSRVKGEFMSEVTNQVMTAALDVLEKNPWGIVRTIGTKLYTKLLKNKVSVAINLAYKFFRVAAAELSKDSLYQKRMNEGLVLLMDSIISSLVFTAMLKASAWLAKRNKYKKLMMGLNGLQFFTYWWRTVNIICFSLALSITDVAVNEGIVALGDITGLAILKSAALGQSVGLLVVTTLTTYMAIPNAFSLTRDGIEILKDIPKRIRANKKSKIKTLKMRKQLIEQELKKIESELVAATKDYNSNDSRVALMKF